MEGLVQGHQEKSYPYARTPDHVGIIEISGALSSE